MFVERVTDPATILLTERDNRNSSLSSGSRSRSSPNGSHVEKEDTLNGNVGL